ncbi:MAG TPA: hypothetical protein GX743_02705, partial [Actinomycetales bacterium]|nr:hypothetical protein [Actinomycetales bacterium]
MPVRRHEGSGRAGHICGHLVWGYLGPLAKLHGRLALPAPPHRGDHLPEQAATLWNNPWILAPAAGAIAIATVVGAVIFVPEPNPVTAVAAWVTIVLAAAVLFLGSPHRLL